MVLCLDTYVKRFCYRLVFSSLYLYYETFYYKTSVRLNFAFRTLYQWFNTLYNILTYTNLCYLNKIDVNAVEKSTFVTYFLQIRHRHFILPRLGQICWSVLRTPILRAFLPRRFSILAPTGITPYDDVLLEEIIFLHLSKSKINLRKFQAICCCINLLRKSCFG